ncbi:hypothetical protein [Streptomyces sp. NPDC058953]|uniref:hypothetical protein n=1 Tax=unclassified Streptomyces TaxID=2593676 RepID=UPI003677A468
MTDAKEAGVEQQIADLKAALEKKADKAAAPFLTAEQVHKEALKEGGRPGEPLATQKWVKAQGGEPAGGGGGGTQIGPFTISPEMVKTQPDVLLLALGLVLFKIDLSLFDLSEKINNVARRPFYGAGNMLRRWLHGAPAPEPGEDPDQRRRRRFYQLPQAREGSRRARIGLAPGDEDRAWRTPMDRAQRDMDLLNSRIAALEEGRTRTARNTVRAGGGGDRSRGGQNRTDRQNRSPGGARATTGRAAARTAARATTRPGAGGRATTTPDLRTVTQDANALTRAVDGR